MSVNFSLDELPLIADKIVQQLAGGDVVALIGSLASGKTTLTKALLQALGYQGRVSSPTFVLERRYPLNHPSIKEVAHLDLYRLSPETLTSFDWHEQLGDQDVLTIIEWPEIAAKLLPPETKTFRLEIIDATHRRLTPPPDFKV